MRCFRLSAITVLLVACAVLGSACAGAKGEQGEAGADGVGIEDVVFNADGTMTVNLTDGEKYTSGNLAGPQGVKGDTGPQGAQGIQGMQGIQGIQGIQGEAGPNTIVAMGCIDMGGNILQGYNVTSVTWDGSYYQIVLTGIAYAASDYVTVVTPYFNRLAYHQYTSGGGKLYVAIHDGYQFVDCGFSFMVLECP